MLNFLVVDDDETACIGYVHRITDMKIPQIKNISMAFSAEEAISIFDDLNIDVLITDIQMYDLSGLELIEHVRKKKADTACIVITAYDFFQYAQKAIRLNVDDFLLKPCSIKEMKDVIQKTVTRVLAARGDERKTSETLDPIAWACQYTQENICKNIDMALIANHLNLSYSYFSKLFKERTGRTYSDYLTEEKMKEAGRLLRKGLKITEVAEELGYQHAPNFSRAFYKYWKITAKGKKESIITNTKE